MQLLDTCLMGNKIASLQHICFTLLDTCANGVKFYCSTHAYAEIPYCIIFPSLVHCEKVLFSSSTQKSSSKVLEFFFQTPAFESLCKLDIYLKTNGIWQCLLSSMSKYIIFFSQNWLSY